MIVPMKRLSLVALQSDEERLLEALQRAGSVEILNISETDVPSERLDAAQDRIQRLNDSIEAIKPYAEKKSFLSPQKREASLSGIREDSVKAETVTDQIEALLRKKASLISEREKLNTQMEDLRPWEELSSPMSSVHNTKRVTYLIGYCAQKDQAALESQEYLETQFLGVGTEIPTIVACKNEDVKVTQNFLKGIEWTDFVFPKSDDTPAQAIGKIEKRISEIENELIEIDTDITKFSSELDLLENAADAAVIERDLYSAESGLAKTKSAFVLEGWVREDQVEKTEEAVKSVTEAYSFEIRDPQEDEIPPSVVKNNKIVTPFEEVQTLYSRPDPYGMDGTPYMTPFYILLFGLMRNLLKKVLRAQLL